MKLKRIFVAALALMFGLTLVACGGGDKKDPTKEPTKEPTVEPETGGQTKEPETGDKTPEPQPQPQPGELPNSVDGELKIWVGAESKDFYQTVANEWIEKYNADKPEGKKFTATITVAGVDASGAAGVYLQDTEAGADIFTVPHDNLGKLLAGAGTIAPVTNYDLMDQMEEQNSDSFLDVCYLQAGDGSAAQYYAVPYISQALVYMYNKADFAGKEDKLTSWEGILEVAKETNKLAVCYTGTDGYNFSNFLLAQPANEQAKAVFGNTGTLKLYDKGSETGCYNYGDDQVAIMRYAQRFVKDVNGRNGALTSSDGWEVDLQNNKALGVISGAWNYKGACKAMGGDDKVGVVQLPKFTLTEDDAYGKATAGMEFWSGSFADCKAFVKKKDTKFAGFLDSILLYLTSDEIQKRSFEEANNLPASGNIVIENNELAAAQVASAQHGIPQPFGAKPNFNDFYYSHGTDAMYTSIVQNQKDAYSGTDVILNTLQRICWTWERGTEVSKDSVLEKWVKAREGNFQNGK